MRHWPWMVCVVAVVLTACSPKTEETPVAEEEAGEVGLPAAEAAAPEMPTTGGTVTGRGVIELRNGVIRDLAGLELVLVPEETVAEITQIRNERWRMRASRFNFNDGYNNLDLDAIGGTAVKRAVASAKADDQGVYRFVNVPPGKYRLYAQYRSMYAVGYWLLPVEIKAVGDVVELNLRNENFSEVFNYQQRPWQR